MASQRIQRVQNLLRSEISTVIQRRIKDPRVAMVTITRLEVDPDLRHARVFVSVLGDRDARVTALAGLHSAARFIRSELMKVLHLRPVPELDFRDDQSLARAARTLDLLDQIRDEQERAARRTGAGDRTDPKQ